MKIIEPSVELVEDFDAAAVMKKAVYPNMREWSGLKADVKDALSGFIFSKTGRSPMILPIIMEV